MDDLSGMWILLILECLATSSINITMLLLPYSFGRNNDIAIPFLPKEVTPQCDTEGICQCYMILQDFGCLHGSEHQNKLEKVIGKYNEATPLLITSHSLPSSLYEG